MSQHLLALEKVSLAYGIHPLLDEVKLQVSPGERICLIGRNGAGKSSMLKIIEGCLQPDSGTVWRKPALRVGRLMQELPQDLDCTVYEFVASGLDKTGKLLADYHATLQELTDEHSAAFDKLAKLQKQIDACDGWQLETTIQSILTRLDLPADKRMSELSGGWQRRVALAKALVVQPELLLLDEPTNHLDIAAIQWLETQLLGLNIGLVFITHDRALLQRLATRIIELDRGQLTSWPGDYENFLRRKAEMLHAEAKQNADFDKKLAQEEKWIRQGIKARRTRNEGRVRALEAMRRERQERRNQVGKASFNVNEARNSGRMVIEAEHISYQINEQMIVKDFSTRIMRGDRIGLVGKNGAGKTTLLNLLLGKLAPQQGTVTQGTQLQIAYFDQLRAALDPEKTVIDNVAGGQEFITVNDKSMHIISYLGDFLFTPERARTPVKVLSGGECNRLLLARLFTQPANLLVLDEPTNDLDIETLELLEELLSTYQGTLLIVSHDRAFLDNVVTNLFVFEGDGKIEDFVGSYSDWERYRQTQQVAAETHKATAKLTAEKKANTNKVKLSYKEQRELADLPKHIEKLEKQIADMQIRMADADFYKQTAEEVNKQMAMFNDLTAQLEQAFVRWEALEAMQQGE